MMEYKNVFYFDNINVIGGVESFFYYLASKYDNNDITIFYSSGNINQIKRLKKVVRVKKYHGEKIKCEKVFFSYEPVIINDVEAEEYIGIVHANYKEQNITPKPHKKITRWIGVSKEVCKAWEELTGLECELCYNPIKIQEIQKPLIIVSATRLTSEKGKENYVRVAERLDSLKIPYVWFILTNDTNEINNSNIIYVDPKIDVLKYLKMADVVAQLSPTESFGYTPNESLMLGTPVLLMDLPIWNELGIKDGVHGWLIKDIDNFDFKKIFKKLPSFEYESPKDNWKNILAKGESTYKNEPEIYYEVEALDTYQRLNVIDSELKEIPKKGDRWLTIEDRLYELLKENDYNVPFIKVNKEVTDVKEWEEENL